MNKMMTIALALLSVSMLAQARTVTGVVKGENKPLGSVLVTDGFSFAQTDAKGNYSLDVNDKARFVYIVTPKGYVADYSTGVPQFYQRLEEGKNTYSFALQAMKGDKNRYAMITMADPQLDVDTDIDKLYAEALPDIRETAAKHKDVQVAGIVLGDISWDVYSHNEIYKDFAKKAGFPIYPVIGNHDFDWGADAIKTNQERSFNGYSTPVLGAHIFKYAFEHSFFKFFFSRLLKSFLCCFICKCPHLNNKECSPSMFSHGLPSLFYNLFTSGCFCHYHNLAYYA